MADIIYNDFLEDMGEELHNMASDVFKICLLSDGHTPSAAHSTYADISANELSDGNGYTTGGVALANVAWAKTGGVVKFDADDAQWPGANFTSRYGVIYNTSSGDRLVCLIDFLENKQAAGITFEIRFDTDGIFDGQQG